ncbi:MAG: hypothetical protein QOJ72_1610 [Nocardioidaceae bacterium]|nr:hypothetical protein [Nocardioidaceae bacterium]
MKKLLAVLLFAVLAACGGHDTKSNDPTAAISKSLVHQADLKAIGVDLDKKRADCIAKGWVKDIGSKKLKKYGVVRTTASGDHLSMSAPDAQTAAGDLGKCVDLKAAMSNVFHTYEALPTEVSDCIVKTARDEDLEFVFVDVFTGQAPALNAMLSNAPTCLGR